MAPLMKDLTPLPSNDNLTTPWRNSSTEFFNDDNSRQPPFESNPNTKFSTNKTATGPYKIL